MKKRCIKTAQSVAMFGVVLIAALAHSVSADTGALAEWTSLAQHYLESKQTATQTRVTVYAPENPLDMPKCSQLEAFMPVGARTQGLTSVGVRCLAPKQWALYLKAKVEVIGDYFVSHTALAAGHVISEADIDCRQGDLTALPANAITDKTELLGRLVATSIPVGQIWRRDQLKVTYAVQAGQAVQLRIQGGGFQVTGDGVAVSNGAEGQSVQVRTPKGGLVTGIAHMGAWVELRL